MDLPLPHDFKEFLVLLNSEKIDYLIVGGYAVSYHGYPRPTGDLDVWVAMHPETATKLVDALAKFGFASAGATKGKLPRQGHSSESDFTGWVSFPVKDTVQNQTLRDGMGLGM
jgi:hypothetical protein